MHTWWFVQLQLFTSPTARQPVIVYDRLDVCNVSESVVFRVVGVEGPIPESGILHTGQTSLNA